MAGPAPPALPSSAGTAESAKHLLPAFSPTNDFQVIPTPPSLSKGGKATSLPARLAMIVWGSNVGDPQLCANLWGQLSIWPRPSPWDLQEMGTAPWLSICPHRSAVTTPTPNPGHSECNPGPSYLHPGPTPVPNIPTYIDFYPKPLSKHLMCYLLVVEVREPREPSHVDHPRDSPTRFFVSA